MERPRKLAELSPGHQRTNEATLFLRRSALLDLPQLKTFGMKDIPGSNEEEKVRREKVCLSEKSIRQLVRKAMSWDEVMKISLSQQMINCHKSFLATTLGLIMLGTKRIPNA